ncbi:MAG TPA: RNA polymerase subunit sigma-70 [Candidatus Limnocylindria bacterium]|jgi:RNA polymerase sigma-70 factor (ECF subfamily)
MTELRAGMVLDEASFGPMTESLRRDLLVHCYRFSGSFTEAEDLVQETLAKAWRARAGYRGEAGLRTWLRRIATRVCLDALRTSRSRRTLPSAAGEDNGHEVLWLDPLPDHLLIDVEADPAAAYDLRESVSLAFLTALQRLPARQRAVLILRDVLALRATEVASQLEISESSVTSLLHRARQTMRKDGVKPRPTAPADATTADLLHRYVRAWGSGDVHALLALLKRDATLEMPPVPFAPAGHAAIGAFLADGILDGTEGRWHGLPTAANGGPALAMYERTAHGYRFIGVHLLAIDGDAIDVVTAFMDDGLAGRFEVPATISA